MYLEEARSDHTLIIFFIVIHSLAYLIIHRVDITPKLLLCLIAYLVHLGLNVQGFERRLRELVLNQHAYKQVCVETKLIKVELLFVIKYLFSDRDENVLEELDEFFVVLDSLALAISIDKGNHFVEVLHDLL